MALMNCPECNHQVSDKATFCPNCGFPIKETVNMDIIDSPECNHQISCKESSCSNWGCPISLNNIKTTTNKTSSQSYCVIFNRLGKPNKIEIIKMVRQIGNYDLKTAKDIVDFPPSVIIKNISHQTAEDIQERFDVLGAVTSIEKLDTGKNQNNSKQEIEIKNILKNNKDDTVRCPRCGSSAITTGQRGFSIVTGFLGSNKTVNRCGKCGYSWRPK